MADHSNTYAENKISSSQAPSHTAIYRLPGLVLLLIGVTLAMLTSLLFMASDCEPTNMMDTLSSLSKHISTRGLLIGGSIVAILGIGSIGIFIGLACLIVHHLIRPQNHTSFIPLTPFMLDLPVEEITFSSEDKNHQVQGIYVSRPKATTTIVLSPGYRRPLADVLGICKHLWVAGHNVLAFEYYGHGAIVGVPITLGYREIHDFLGAVAYAKQRAPKTRIGALGYAMGAAVSILGATRCSDVEALVADSPFATHRSAVEMAVRQAFHLPANTFIHSMNLLLWITDIILVQRAGYHFFQVEPYREIARLAPRPILLIHALNDTVVPPNDSVQLYEAASRPKALWHIPHTEHARGYFTDGAAYIVRVLAFFDRYLKNQSVLTSTQNRQPSGAEGDAEEESALSETKQTVPYFWQRGPTKHPIPAQAGQATNERSLQVTIESLRQIVAWTLRIPPGQICESDDFFAYGGDSHSLKELLSQIKQQWHIQLEANDVFNHSEIQHLAAIIRQKQQ